MNKWWGAKFSVLLAQQSTTQIDIFYNPLFIDSFFIQRGHDNSPSNFKIKFLHNPCMLSLL